RLHPRARSPRWLDIRKGSPRLHLRTPPRRAARTDPARPCAGRCRSRTRARDRAFRPRAPPPLWRSRGTAHAPPAAPRSARNPHRDLVSRTGMSGDTYEAGIEIAASLQRLDGPDVNPACHTRLYTHGRRTEQSVVLLHGFTNCP